MSYAGEFAGAQTLALAGVLTGVVVSAVEVGLTIAERAEAAHDRAETLAFAAAVAGEEMITIAGAVAGIEAIKLARAVVGVATAVFSFAATTVSPADTIEISPNADAGSSSPSRAVDGAVASIATATRALDSPGKGADTQDAGRRASATSNPSADEEASRQGGAGEDAG
jgi:hypothetical protein